MAHALRVELQAKRAELAHFQQDFSAAFGRALQRTNERTARAALRLDLLDPSLVLQRGYAWLTLENGHALTSVSQADVGLSVRATLADGRVDLIVVNSEIN